MQKKATVSAILLFLLFSLLSSCTKLPEYTMYTGGERGTYYNLGRSISSMLGENEDTSGEKDDSKFTAKVKVLSSSGYKQNIDALVAGEAQLAIVRNDIAYSALNGKGVYKGKKKEGFSAIANLYREAVYIITNEDITSAEELNDKKISVGEKGGANEAVADILLSELGVSTYEKSNTAISKTVEDFSAGRIDAFVTVSETPSALLVTLASNVKFNIISIDEEMLADICEQNKFFTPCKVSKKTYSVLKEDLNTVSLYATFLVSDSLSEEEVYNITKRLAEDNFLLYHDKSEEIIPENMWSDLCVPLHKGAEEYLEYYTENLPESTTDESESTSSPDEEDANPDSQE